MGYSLFIIGLLIIIQAIEDFVIIELAANLLEPIIADFPSLCELLMVNIAGSFIRCLNNIPISAALAVIAMALGIAISLINGKYSGLSMIVGVNVRSYLTPIASPANILDLSFLEKEPIPISFK